MKKIFTVVGARPQIIKASAISRAISLNFSEELKEIIVHTGQHYDSNMSQVFFDELKIPKPFHNLNIGSASSGEQTGKMIIELEKLLQLQKPDGLIVYGDTNSTLAASIAASKMNIPVFHIEAGLRSFNKKMPEEINRIVCDHTSTLLFSPTKQGVTNLSKEGFSLKSEKPYTADNPKVYHCGDIMYDNSLHFSDLADQKSTILDDLNLKEISFFLATVHRASNTDNELIIKNIFDALMEIATKKNIEVVVPLHPRTQKAISDEYFKELNKKIKVIEPVSFLDMIALEKNAELIITDSGGVQKEAYFFKKPSVILREETEWTEIVENGNAILTGNKKEDIVNAVTNIRSKELSYPPIFGGGKAAEFICERIIEVLNQ
jgi:UDP-GlcNAc3NAcA epimerase